jgi:hypothetical protein
MDMIKLLGLVPFFLVSVSAGAQDLPPYVTANQVLHDHFPDRQFSVWTLEAGDLNGDGIDDLALIVTAPRENTQNDERLLVFAGNRDKTYSVLAFSAEFCHVRKFYNLSIAKSSLFVQGVMTENGNSMSSLTLQFRYNPRRKDLELIGREYSSADYAQNTSERVSTNYLTGAVHREGTVKNKRKQARVQLPRSAGLLSLNGFDCLTYQQDEPGN